MARYSFGKNLDLSRSRAINWWLSEGPKDYTMSVLKFVAPAVVLLAGVAATSMTSYAKPEYVKATKKACAYCHVGDAKVKPTVLTPAGDFYKKNKTLDGYVEQK